MADIPPVPPLLPVSPVAPVSPSSSASLSHEALLAAADRLRRPFIVGVVLVLVMFVAIGVVVKVVDTKHRPEGAAERWLDAVSDTTRSGVKSDGQSRAAKAGPGVSYASLISAHTDNKSAFEDIEVGKATIDGSRARVPFDAHQQGGHLLEQTVLLARQANGTWLVTGVTSRLPGELVPSQGGKPPSKVGGAAWLIAIALALGLAGVCSVLVRWAGPPPVVGGGSPPVVGGGNQGAAAGA